VDTTAVFKYTTEDPKPGYKSMKLRIFNTLGGHSGDDINKDRINTIQQMARFLYEEEVPYQLIEINGGGKHNAIPRECQAIITVPEASVDDVVARFNAFGETLKAEYHNSDAPVKVSAEVVRCNEKPISKATADKIILSLLAVFHGVLGMSQDIPGLVETSSNLAAIHMKNAGEVEVVTSQRSSVDSQKEFISDKISALFKLAGAKVFQSDDYPGWAPDMNSKILKVAVDAYRKLFGHDPEVKAIHAGLECGLFLQKFPGLDMVSFGPTLRNVHTPGEKLDLDSLDKFTKHLVEVVTSFK
jgi:dipeptidase D